MQISIDDAKIEGLVRHGYLAPSERNDAGAIMEAASLFVWDLLASEAEPDSLVGD